ncbi:hypothetical protein ACPC1L_29065, partial [Nonomuraea bangladeshensis]
MAATISNGAAPAHRASCPEGDEADGWEVGSCLGGDGGRGGGAGGDGSDGDPVKGAPVEDDPVDDGQVGDDPE